MWSTPTLLTSSVVDYASTAIIEVRTDNTLRLLFRNGTQGSFNPVQWMGQSNPNTYDIGRFMEDMQPYSLETLSSWCDACQTTDARGCNTLAALNGTGGAGYASIDSTTGRHHVSPVVAGVIGAMVTLAFAAFAMGIWSVLQAAFRRRQGLRGGSSIHSSSTHGNEVDRIEKAATSSV